MSSAGNRIFGAVVGLAAAAALAVSGWLIATQAVRMATWVPAEGSVMESRVSVHRGSKGSKQYRANVRYVWGTSESPRTGTRLYAGWGPRSAGKSESERIVKEYPPGKAVTVYVDPADQNGAFLIRAWRFSAYLVWALGAAAGALLIGTVLGGASGRVESDLVQGFGPLQDPRMPGSWARPRAGRGKAWKELAPMGTLRGKARGLTGAAVMLWIGAAPIAHYYTVAGADASLTAHITAGVLVLATAVLTLLAWRGHQHAAAMDDARVFIDSAETRRGGSMGVRVLQRLHRTERAVVCGAVLRCVHSQIQGKGKQQKLVKTTVLEIAAKEVSVSLTVPGTDVTIEDVLEIPANAPHTSPPKEKSPRHDWVIEVKTSAGQFQTVRRYPVVIGG